MDSSSLQASWDALFQLPLPSKTTSPGEVANMQVAPWPKSFVILENGARAKRRRIISPNSSAAADYNQNEMAWASMHDIWKLLPEEILDTIRSLLPFLSQLRFRSVCRKWNHAALSLPAPLMILSRRGDQNATFFYEPQKKWFKLPIGAHHFPDHVSPWPEIVELHQGRLGRKSEIHVIDVEGGLVCYQTECNGHGGRFSDLWVSNPLKNSVSGPFAVPNRLIGSEYFPSPRAKAKLIVDKKTKAFNIILPGDWWTGTRVYEPPKDRWGLGLEFRNGGGLYLKAFELFKWENVVYAYSRAVYHGVQENKVAAYDILLDKWIIFSAKIPFEPHVPTRHLIISDIHQVLLVLYSSRRRKRPYISVWKLSDEGLGFGITKKTSWENWKKVPLESTLESKIGLDLSSHLLAHACLGADYICFIFRHFKAVKKEQERERYGASSSHGYYGFDEDSSEESPKCLRYSLAKGSWSVMDFPKEWTGDFRVYSWEPTSLINSSLQEFGSSSSALSMA